MSTNKELCDRCQRYVEDVEGGCVLVGDEMRLCAYEDCPFEEELPEEGMVPVDVYIAGVYARDDSDA